MSLFKNNFVVGLTAALAASILTPVLLPAIRRGSRPAAKGVIRGGMLLYRKGRQAVASSGEMVEDVLAEIRAEEMNRRNAAGSEAGASRPAGEARMAGPVGVVRTVPDIPPQAATSATGPAATAAPASTTVMAASAHAPGNGGVPQHNGAGGPDPETAAP